MLADNVLERSSARPERFEAQERGARILLAREDDAEHLRHLGVPELDGDGRSSASSRSPTTAEPLRGHGHLLLRRTVFDMIPTLEPSGRGELEITDVNNLYVEQGTMEYDVLEGFWGDAGESIDAYYAVNDFVRANGANQE